jgi:hypothetical protein
VIDLLGENWVIDDLDIGVVCNVFSNEWFLSMVAQLIMYYVNIKDVNVTG